MAGTRVSYCAELVRRQDRDRYLTALFAPADRREDLFALYAFNLEVAKTAELVSDATLGQIRLQWWREAIDEVYRGRPRAHAVVEPLARTVERRSLPRAPFDRLIDAREADLTDQPPPDLAALEAYAEATSASLFALALAALGGRAEESPGRQLAHHLGLAWALAGLARAVPFHARQKRCYLPQEITRAAGLDLADLFELHALPALNQVVETLSVRAAEHLQTARGSLAGLPPSARSLLLFAPLAVGHLGRLRRAGFDPFDREVRAERPGAVWRLAWSHWLRRY